MRNFYVKESVNFALIMLIVSAGLMGCATLRLPEVELHPVTQYRLFQEKEGLKVSVDPFFEEDRVKEFFGADLLSEGILPVLVVAENHSPKSTFLLQKGKFQLGLIEGEATSTPTTANPSKPKKSARGIYQITSASILVAPLIVSLGVFLPIASKAHGDAEAITQNFVKKELLEKTILPGGAQHGFVYFKLQDEEALRNVSTVEINVMNLSSGETIKLQFALENEEEGHEQ